MHDSSACSRSPPSTNQRADDEVRCRPDPTRPETEGGRQAGPVHWAADEGRKGEEQYGLTQSAALMGRSSRAQAHGKGGPGLSLWCIQY